MATKKRRTIGVKTARKMLAGARKRKTKAERDETRAMSLLSAAQKRVVKRATPKCSTKRRTGRKKGRRRTRSGTLS